MLEPYDNKQLLVLDKVRDKILDNFFDKKLHHSLLFVGDKGLGKATLAYHIANKILDDESSLKENGGLSLFGDTLSDNNLDENNPTFNLIKNKKHPDLLVIEKEVDSKTSKIDKEIKIASARKINDFMSMAPFVAKNKVIIIDAIDEMNTSAQNAILKNLEEPHKNTYILLVCHNINNILETIISRCERIDIQNFPQCAYSTDAYLTFLSSQYQQVVGSSTARTERDLQTSVVTSSVGAVGSIVDSGVGLASGNTPSAGTFTGPISSTFNALTVAGQYNLYNNVMNEASAMRNIGPSGVSLVEKGDAISTAYDVAKPAYVADIYHAGSSGGYLPYQFIGTPGYFTIEVATLKDTYVKQIDNYFTCYGYKSGRFGVPRVCNFVKGASNTPHFEEWDGAPITYVKTNNMNVTHSNNIVVSYIERLFNLGCRFLNGDEL